MEQQNFSQGKTSDSEIIDLYWNRDEKAIALTDEKYGRYLFTIAYNIIRNHLDSEECVNDTYLHTWNRIPPAKPTLLQVFLSKITRDVAVDKFRKMTAAKRIPSEMVHSLEELEDCITESSAVEKELLAQQISEVLNGFLRSLPKKDAYVFVCRYYYSDSLQSIADMLGVAKATVQRMLNRSRNHLRGLLEKEGVL